MARKPILEQAVLEILWDADSPLTPAEVRERIPIERRGAYTTIMTVLVRLWKKGLLRREQAGRAYAYAPKLSRETYTASRMERLLDDAGHRSKTLARFIMTLSESERRHLRSLLEDEDT